MPGVFASGPIAPFTTETKPAALTPSVPVLVKLKLSPTEYPDPALSIIISVTPPEPISSIAILAPEPPPVTVSKSVVLYKLPSLVIVFAPGIPVMFAFIK